jgi:hypothetical protein
MFYGTESQVLTFVASVLYKLKTVQIVTYCIILTVASAVVASAKQSAATFAQGQALHGSASDKS